MGHTTTNRYQMWFTCNAEKEKIQLPVLPTTFQTNFGSKNESIDIMGLGEIVIMQSRPALQFSFSSFFPATTFPGLQVAKITKPLTLVQQINEWKSGKEPVHFITTACGIDLYCTIESFNYSEVGGDPGTYQYSIKLKEYREISTRQVKVDIPKATATVQQESPRVDNTVQQKTYTVREGDCPYYIAKKVYGDTSKHKDITKANPHMKTTGGANGDLVPQQVILLP